MQHGQQAARRRGVAGEIHQRRLAAAQQPQAVERPNLRPRQHKPAGRRANLVRPGEAAVIEQLRRRPVGSDLARLRQGRMFQFRRTAFRGGVPDAAPGVGVLARLVRLARRPLAVRRRRPGRDDVAGITDVDLAQFIDSRSLVAGGNPKVPRHTRDGFMIEGLDDQFARCHRAYRSGTGVAPSGGGPIGNYTTPRAASTGLARNLPHPPPGKL